MFMMIAIVAISVVLVAIGHYRHRTLSFRDDINESNRQFHRARLEEIPDLVSRGLINSDHLTAFESEPKHDLLSDMRGSETRQPRNRHRLVAIEVVYLRAFGWRGCSGSYADFGAPWVASKRWYGRRH